MVDLPEQASPYLVNYAKYLNIPHNYKTDNCLSIIAKFYENELKIPMEEEKVLFNNFSIDSIKDLRRIPIENIYSLKNWVKINLTELKEFDIIIYTRNEKLAHFSMYMGNNKILDLREQQKSKLRHLNDTERNHIESFIRNRLVVAELYRITL